MLTSPLAQLVDAAAAATCWLDYERPLFELLDRSIGFDLAFCVRASGVGGHAPGSDRAVLRRLSPNGVYAHECAPMRQHALRGCGVVVDAEFYGRAGLERTMVYRDLMRPHRGRSSLIMYTEGLTLVLGRTGSDFRSSECESLAAARSLIALCEEALTARRFSRQMSPALSPRERELLSYLRLGYTNREIASACGTSFRTVRNQLSYLFEKLEASTRSEAVARSFELALPLE